MKLTALIPAYNDAYALWFCLASIVDHFDEIIVLDDASTDETPDVACGFATRHKNIRYVRHEGAQLGWIDARNRLLALTDSNWLFWLDSDDVLCEYNAHLLQDVAQGSSPVVLLQLAEMWGDFYHTTQRLRHFDPCHVFTNRRFLNTVYWSARGTRASLITDNCSLLAYPIRPLITPARSAGPLFFHMKGVKSDRRLVERRFYRKWLSQGMRAARLGAYVVAHPPSGDGERAHGRAPMPLDDLSEQDIHRIALDVLLHSPIDRLTPTYILLLADPLPLRTSGGLGGPVRPAVIEGALPGRFRIVYQDGVAVDRMDRDAVSERAGPDQAATRHHELPLDAATDRADGETFGAR